MNFETKPRIGRGTRRTALGASLAMAAVGALAAPAFAAPALTVSGSPQTGANFTVNVSGLTESTGYRVYLTTTGGSEDQAEANDCETGKTTAATGAGSTTLTCTLRESSAGDYSLRLLNAAGTSVLLSQNVTITGTTAELTAPSVTDQAGTANDSVTITKTDGVIWKVDGQTVTFATGATTAVVPVTDGAAVVTAEAASGYALPTTQRTSWSLKFGTTDQVLQSTPEPATGPVFTDNTGATTDAVKVTKAAGVDWYVNGNLVTFTGAATEATVLSTRGSQTTVEARAADGYVFPNGIGSVFYRSTLTGEYVEPSVTRLAGENRMDTAVEISKKYWTNADTVYVANGLRFADALTAGPAAAKDGGPLLLAMQDSVPANVLDEIRRLKPTRIHIVGGTSVVSSGVESTLSGIAPVTRLAGGNRYETAAAVSTRWADGSAPVVYIAYGENFPDALSGGSGAAIEDGALLLSPGTTLSQPTVDALKRVKAKKIVLVGGTNVLAEAVRLQAEELNLVVAAPAGGVLRYAGADRYATSAAVADKSGSADAADKTLFLATGLNFPDALAGVPAADKVGAPLFLSQLNCLPPAVKTEINKMTAVTEQVRLGSSGVLGNFPLTQVCAS